MEALAPTNQKLSPRFKFSKKKVKLQGQKSQVQVHGINWKVFPDEIHMWNP
jgi:hypothetical protein